MRSHVGHTLLSCGSPRSDAESSASLYTSAESNLGDRVLSEVEKDSFITLPGKGGTQQAPASKTCVSSLGEDRSFIVIVQIRRDQLMDILLMGWW